MTSETSPPAQNRLGQPWSGVLRGLCTLLLLALGASSAEAQDLPGTPVSRQLIPAGSLIIAMDNDKQNIGALFNLKAYGLAVRLLNNDVPMKWAIRAGKAKDGVDFTARARRIAPSTLAETSLNFSGGPLIVHKAYAVVARTHITAFGGNVAVYELTEDVTVDVRYELLFKPRPFVNSASSSIATKTLIEAGITNYVVGGAESVGLGSCYTIILEPHNTSTVGNSNTRSFLQSGGNLYAQCASVTTFENDATNGRYLTTGGIVVANTSATATYPNPDLSFSQFVGAINSSPGGSEEDWRLATGSAFRAGAHSHTQAAGVSPQSYSHLVGKVGTGVGGLIFYAGGHDHSGSTLGDFNNRRMMLNAILTPANRPVICNIVVQVADLTVAKTRTGEFRVGRQGTYTITASNSGTASTADTIVVTDTLPSGTSFVFAGGSGWLFTTQGQVVTARYGGVLAAGASASFTLTVELGASSEGQLTNRVHVSGGGEVNLDNNSGSNVATVGGAGTANLAVLKAGAGRIAIGDTLRYVITVSNAGPDSAFYVSVRDSLPTGVRFLSASRGGVLSGFVVEWPAFGPVAPGGSRADTVLVEMPLTLATITNVAFVTSASTDPDPSNNNGSSPASRVTTVVGATVEVLPDGLASPLLRLPGTGYSQVFTVTNLSGMSGSYDLLLQPNSGSSPHPPFLRLDSIRGFGIPPGVGADSAQVLLAARTTYEYIAWYTVLPGDGAVNLQVLTARLTGNSEMRDDGWAEVRRVSPALAMGKTVSPATGLAPGADLTYTIHFGNVGEYGARQVAVTDALPPSVVFRVGSTIEVLPPGISATPRYAVESGAWEYVPVSGGCGAPHGFDACVKQIRWELQGELPPGADAFQGTLHFGARIR
jgi:uncharacterized repeat protein (TIGR01451 family)